MILKNKVAAIVSLSVASAFLFTGKTASAIELVNTSVTPVNGGNEFRYDLILEADETIFNASDNPFGFADTLNFENLVGVTSVSFGPNSPYELFGFDATNVNLEAVDTISGATTITDAVIITANAFPGEVDFDLTFDDNFFPTAFNGRVTGPAEPIPLETEATMGIFALGMFFGARTYWKRRQNMKRLNASNGT